LEATVTIAPAPAASIGASTARDSRMTPVRFTASTPIPGLVIQVAQGQVVIHDPGNVGQDVDARSRRGHDPIDVVLVGDVGGQQLGGAARLLEDGLGLGQGRLGEVATDHLGALTSKPQDGCPSDPACCSGHDRDLAGVPCAVHHFLAF
jgi:hypothetical protein